MEGAAQVPFDSTTQHKTARSFGARGANTHPWYTACSDAVRSFRGPAGAFTTLAKAAYLTGRGTRPNTVAGFVRNWRRRGGRRIGGG